MIPEGFTPPEESRKPLPGHTRLFNGRPQVFTGSRWAPCELTWVSEMILAELNAANRANVELEAYLMDRERWIAEAREWFVEYSQAREDYEAARALMTDGGPK